MINQYSEQHIRFHIGEVYSYNDTFKEESLKNNNGYLIDVYIIIDDEKIELKNVKPANNNVKQLPIIGEHVLIFQGFKENSSFYNKTPSWYYLSVISAQTLINDNILPINTISKTFKSDTEHTTIDVSPLQPYGGDILFEGRWGNSLRFGSTSKSSERYTLTSTWSGDVETDPIIILSNDINKRDKYKFRVEDIETDTSALYLTTSQKISNLKLTTPLSVFLPSESNFSNSQFIGSADRVILKAKTDTIILDSPTAVIINTPGEFKIGNDGADESMVHGNVLMEILQLVINQLQTVMIAGSNIGKFTDYSNATKAQSKLQALLSSKYFIKKNTY